MQSELFRKKSIERISSPEQMNDYLRVSNPSVWVMMTAIIVLLIGVCVWSIFGRIETRVSVVVISDGDKMIGYLRDDDKAEVELGDPLLVEGQECVITGVSSFPVTSGGLAEYARYIGDIREGEWVYELELSGSALPEGIYPSEIVAEEIQPISFVLN